MARDEPRARPRRLRFGVRGKLVVAFLGLMGVVALVSGLYLEHSLHAWLGDRIEHELLRHARTARTLLETTPKLSSTARTETLSERLHAATEARITIIDASGRVLGDSSVATKALASLDNHAERPEIRAARRRGWGTSHRYSETMGTEMVYAAVPFERGELRGMVRAARPLRAVSETFAGLRVLLALGGGIGALAALLMALWAGHLVSQTLRRMVVHARALAAGERRPLDAYRSDELGLLAGSINRLTTELDGTMTRLASERDRLQTILQGMSEAVVALDKNERVTLVNSAAMELFRLHASPVGQQLSESLPFSSLETILSARDDEQATEFELPGPPPRRVLARVSHLHADGGSVLVLHDVTEMRRLETVRRDFVANVSHELRTPVGIIQANAETLLDGALEDRTQARKFLEAILRHAVRISRLIADLLDLSRIEAGRYGLEATPVGLRDVVSHTADSVESPAREGGVTIAVDVAETLYVSIDERAFEQVLFNLLDNAIKYSPEGAHIRVTAEPVAEDSAVRIAVADEGPGIDPAHRERIFERFYRVDPGRSRMMGGTGLGLSIVRHLVEAMGGRVGIEANSPKGSVFWFTVPRARADAA